MVLKGVEYYHHYLNHEFPGLAFDYTVPDARAKQIFFFLYFAMTGLHAVHLTIGIVLVCVVLFWACRRAYSPEYYTPVENAGLYWHFVDIVWIFLFPLLYLIDIHH
jgi:cytochrome c oxidase subunit 3